MIYKVTVQYDGSNYHGWQTQSGGINVKSIQKTINRCVNLINKEVTEIVASGRTDKGVHALGQVFHFKQIIEIEPLSMKAALNSTLPKDIRVVDVSLEPDDFHARFSATSKEYHYLLNTGEYNLFERNYINQYGKKLDIDLMKAASELLVGTHDFSSFNTTTFAEKRNQTRTIIKIEISLENDIIKFVVVGDAFLRHMVRMIVGILVYVGAHKKTMADLEDILLARSKEMSVFNIEASGLYLVKVNY